MMVGNMAEHECTFKAYIEGPRWAGIPSFVRKAAWEHNLTIIELTEDKHFLTTTVYYKLGGNTVDCNRCRENIEYSIECVNKELPG